MGLLFIRHFCVKAINWRMRIRKVGNFKKWRTVFSVEVEDQRKVCQLLSKIAYPKHYKQTKILITTKNSEYLTGLKRLLCFNYVGTLKRFACWRVCLQKTTICLLVNTNESKFIYSIVKKYFWQFEFIMLQLDVHQ